MEFRILGPLEVISDGQSLDLGGAKQRALLAVLLLNPNQVVSRDRLIDALWEENPPETAQKALQVHVSRLRRLLGSDRILTKTPGYAIRIEPGELDAERFERLAAELQPAEALVLWRGPPLDDVAHTRFARQEIGRLEERRLAVLEERIEAELALGRRADLIAELEALVAEHPLRERFRALLMLALYRSGRQAQALDVYQDARRTLVDELGIEPGRDLRELHQTILRQDPALEPKAKALDEEPILASGFVGRELELAELSKSLDDAFEGRGRLFLLQGEPGIGKSRLADEVASRARSRRAHVLVGRCWEAGGAPAYWPWTQSLRAYVRAVEPGAVRRHLGASAADVAQIVPQLRQLFPGLPEPEASDSDAARFQVFDSTAAFLRNVAAERPIVLVLDDIHAADEPSLLLLRYVASSLDDNGVLIIATFRDLDPTVGEALEGTLAELGRSPATRRIRLSGLEPDEVARLAELTGSTAPTEQFLAELYAETEGNPLFVSEIVRLLAAEGRFGSAAEGRIVIPETIRETIGRRLRHLSGECRRVLSLASVFGRDFGLVALERVADYTGIDRLLSVLDEAITARVVEEIPATIGRLRFGHVLTRDSLYEEIPATHRARLHQRVAEVLEGLYADDPEPHLTELAHHFSLAVPAAAPEKAVEYAARAGDHALGALAYEEAARLYELALENLLLGAPGDGLGRCRLLLAKGEAHIRAGNTAVAKEAFQDAAADARRVGGSRELARAAIGYGGRIIWARAGDDDRLVPLLEEALAALGPEEVELRARLLARLSGALRDEHSRSRRDDVSREAVDLARRSGNQSALAYALDARASAIVAADTIDECTGLANELAEVAARINEPERLVAAHHHLLIGRLLVGDVRAGAEHAAAVRIAEELKQPAQLWQARANEALLALAGGRFADAEQIVVDALSIGEAAQPGAAIPINRLHRYALAEARGDVGELEPEIADLAARFSARPVFRCALAHLHARSGRADAAARELDSLARDDFSALPFDQEWLFGMSFLAEVAALLDVSDAASVLYTQLLPWARLNAVDVGEGFRGSVSYYLGLLAAALGRHDDAVFHYETAIEMSERMEARPWLAHAQEEYARTLAARAAPGDLARALELIEQARTAYDELGMDACATQAAALAAEAAASEA